MTYEHTVIDFGAIVPVTPIVGVQAGSGTVFTEVRHSDDNITYTPYAATGGEVTARYVQVRVIVTNPEPSGITAMSITMDAEVVEEEIIDLDTSTLVGAYRIGVGDIRLPIVKTYGFIRTVTVALQSVGPGFTWELVDKDTVVGPRIRIYNSANVLTDAVIDGLIRGV